MITLITVIPLVATRCRLASEICFKVESGLLLFQSCKRTRWTHFGQECSRNNHLSCRLTSSRSLCNCEDAGLTTQKQDIVANDVSCKAAASSSQTQSNNLENAPRRHQSRKLFKRPQHTKSHKHFHQLATTE